MMETDYRGALRTMIGTANPQLRRGDAADARQLHRARTARRRSLPSACGRGSATIALEPARALGDRLWMLEPGGNPWFPIEVARRSRALFPEAHIQRGRGRRALAAGHHASTFVRAPDRAQGAGQRQERERAAPIRDPCVTFRCGSAADRPGRRPLRVSSIAARRSCSGSEAAAGSPLPPTLAQVP